jgi:rfaE bifunctional protein kinase chain/domain
VAKEIKSLLSLVDRFSQKEVAVWGDFILDEYVYGTTRRISREAPVLIISFQKKELSLGGAGNSLLNLHALGASPVPVGVIGSDEAGSQVFKMLKVRGIGTEGLVVSKNYRTPVKTRILAGEDNTRKQQILRIDKEGKVPPDGGLRDSLLKALAAAQKSCQALLISDYNYDTVRKDIFLKVLPAFRKALLPVTLDSRFRLLNFPGVTVATPNEPEVEEAIKTEIRENTLVLQKAGKTILKKLHSPALLITRGSRGMALFENGKPPFHIPVHGTTDIVDVTGAGDTVISVITLALACGATFRQAALLANYAGSVVVMKKGTATVSGEELKQAITS